jgi:hypothetical protein
LVVQVGTQLRYQLRRIDDLHAMLKERGDRVPLGNADEQKPAQDGTVEAWGRAPDNPVGGWYGMKRGPARPVRQPRAAGAGGAGARRGRAQRPQQPDARPLAGRPPHRYLGPANPAIADRKPVGQPQPDRGGSGGSGPRG